MHIRRSIVAAILVATAGCAGAQHAGNGVTASSQQQTAQQWKEYRAQAASLREMADRRQLEADLLAREVGSNDPSVDKKRRLADELRAAAVDAENKAKALSAQVPHNMVQ
ncbi:MAG TPA: hypothetical protein VL261_08840 [Nitrospira sp.]|jgi:hypothetical protein|nr:hypothetical protein [Nitrospira sp.]